MTVRVFRTTPSRAPTSQPSLSQNTFVEVRTPIAFNYLWKTQHQRQHSPSPQTARLVALVPAISHKCLGRWCRGCLPRGLVVHFLTAVRVLFPLLVVWCAHRRAVPCLVRGLLWMLVWVLLRAGLGGCCLACAGWLLALLSSRS